MSFLDFERPIADLEAKLAELRHVGAGGVVDINDEIQRLKRRSEELTRSIFSSLSAWQISQLARHPLRPHTTDYIARIFSGFEELHGDRCYADDPAIVGGIGRLGGRPVMAIGHEKGRETEEKMRRNFGMPQPEGYRKARRLMRLAERFRMPVLTFIDTPGAYPGVGAEQRNQSEAIAGNLELMSGLAVPVVATVIGEGGSGGALALAVADRVYMQEYGTYSVISPEGCASILWKSAEKASQAAEIMGITARYLHEQGFVDRIVEEPLGGAHRDPDAAAARLERSLLEALEELCALETEELLARRQERFMRFGFYKED
ncbi:MAG: acetyl-CoA carboxylase carboxyltransferase subunit alpha [Gammaproteobacteria bacterium]|nr:acetyl-CoA carboxylase carboxyltransferase subunit alpha [Gammaproteobacteria bacterium]MDD9864178.1 acetyl-CoA carboxylase carboxyltransferase subunit alpha [Gammaproteobacteria bacterium]